MKGKTKEANTVKNFRIYYKTIGVTTDTTPYMAVKAATADEAIEIFKARRPWSDVVAIFKD